jgi:hypothetical protein
LREGKTLSFITRGYISHGRTKEKKEYVKGSIIIEVRSLRAFMKENVAAGRLIAKLANENRLAANRAGVSRRVGRARSSGPNRTLQNADIYERIVQATALVPVDIRDEVRSAMSLAAAEGRIRPHETESRVREFVTAYNRQYSKYVPHGGGIMQSLDQQVYDDGPTRLVDTVTHGLWD